MIARLEDLCGIPSAIVLANKLEFKEDILSLSNLESENWFKNLEKKTLDILKKLPIGLRRKIPTSVVVFCLSQSIEWAKFHYEVFDLSYDYSCSFLRSSFFTSKGTIDKEKAAREIIKDTEVSSSVRYCIACYYCFSDAIPALWKQLPEDNRTKVENEVYQNSLGVIGNHKMVILWSRFMLREIPVIMDGGKSFSLHKLMRSFESDFQVSFESRNDTLFKNCFEELNKSERTEVLILCRNELENILINADNFKSFLWEFEAYSFPQQVNLPFEPYIEMVLFLLHRLDDDHLRLFFQPHILYFVLLHLLFWPYQHLFMKTVNRFFDLLPKFDFCLLLEKIVCLVKNKSFGNLCDYHNILREFWMQSPASLKRFFFLAEGRNIDDVFETFSMEEKDNYFDFYHSTHDEELNFWSVIYDLFGSPFTIEDEKILRLIFESATLGEKSDFVRIKGNTTVRIGFETCDLKRVDLFIELCIPKEGIISYKKELRNIVDLKQFLWNLLLDSKLEEVQKILNWALCVEEIKEWQQSILSICLNPIYFRHLTSDNLKCFDKFLEWNFSSDEIEDFKESLVSDVNRIAEWFLYYIFDEKYFQQLKWCFSSEIKFAKFRKDLAFGIIPYIDYNYLGNNRFGQFKKIVEWSALSQEECNDFKRQLVFSKEVIKSYREFSAPYSGFAVLYDEFYAQLIRNKIDEIICWAELSKSELEQFNTLCSMSKEI